MCSIDNDRIRTGAHQHFDSVQSIRLHTHSRSHKKTALGVLRSDRIILNLHKVLVSDKAYKCIVIIHNRKFLYLTASEDASSLLKADAFLGSNQIFLSHHLRDRQLPVILETKVTISNDANKLTGIVYNRNTSDMLFSHKSKSITDGSFRTDSNRIINHTVFGSLHPPDLFALLLYSHVLVDDTYTAGTSHGDSKISLSYSVHRRRHNRSVERNLSCKFSGNIYTSRENFRARRY